VTTEPGELCSAEGARRRATALGWTEQAVGRAAAAAVETPEPARWSRLLALASGALGAGLFASGVVTFVAYNWAALGRFARLGLVQGLLVAAVVGAARLRSRLASQIVLSLGAVLVGALLAVYGQTYQTGADPFELFLLWAALIVQRSGHTPAKAEQFLLSVGTSSCGLLMVRTRSAVANRKSP
jgi:uncharacterized membrane protein